MDIRELLEFAVKEGASDLHITVGTPPVVRVDGELKEVDAPELKSDQTKKMIYSLLNDKQKVKFEEDLELDFSLGISGMGRFRVNIHQQRGSVEAAFRSVSLRIPTVEELELPPMVSEMARLRDGMVLLTGPTGVGKSTTLAAMMDQINRERRCLMITIEDPIEYLHHHHKSIIKQREVYSDTHSFANALRHVLRQDPDVICVGEMRDLETISTALTAAETGHLVLTTLHTPDAPQTVDRIIDVFPPYQQIQVRIQLANCIQGVISQQLLPRIDKKGRVAALEVMIATPAIRNVIRTQKSEQIRTIMQTSSEKGMITMDKYLKELYQKGIISYEVAKSRARSPEDFDRA